MGKKLLPVLFIFSFFSQAEAYVVGSTERYLVNLPNYKVTKHNVLLLDIGHRFTDPFEKEDANGDFENPFYDFLGVDNGANISFAVTYGIGNLFDVSVARYSISKLYILGSRVNIFNEKVDKTPMSLSIEPN